MYDLLRLADRHCNQYPHLHYPEMYLLDQGYRGFFEYPESVSTILKLFFLVFTTNYCCKISSAMFTIMSFVLQTNV